MKVHIYIFKSVMILKLGKIKLVHDMTKTLHIVVDSYLI